MPLIREPNPHLDHYTRWGTKAGDQMDLMFFENVESEDGGSAHARFERAQFETWLDGREEFPARLSVFPRGIHIQGHTRISPSPKEQEATVRIAEEMLYGNRYQRDYFPKNEIIPSIASLVEIPESVRACHAMIVEARERRRFYNGLQSSIFHGKWLCSVFLETMDGEGLIGIRNPVLPLSPAILAFPIFPGWELERMGAAISDLDILLSLVGRSERRDPKDLLEIISKFGDVYLLEYEHVHLQFLSLCGVSESLADWIKCTEEDWKYPLKGDPRRMSDNNPDKEERVLWNGYNLVKKIEFLCEKFGFDPLSEEDTRPEVSLKDLNWIRNQIAHNYRSLPTLRDEVIFNWLKWVLDLSLKYTVETVLEEHQVDSNALCIYREDFDKGITDSPGTKFRFDMSGR